MERAPPEAVGIVAEDDAHAALAVVSASAKRGADTMDLLALPVIFAMVLGTDEIEVVAIELSAERAPPLAEAVASGIVAEDDAHAALAVVSAGAKRGADTMDLLALPVI